MFVLRRVFPLWFRCGGERPRSSPGTERLAVVLLSYRRPENLEAIAGACLACPFVDRVILSNNNPEIDIRHHVRARDARLDIVQQEKRGFPSNRYRIALESGAPWLLCIDDDTFLTPRQIGALFDALRNDPRVPHGVAGENIRGVRADYVFGSAGGSGEADCLVWAYAFTRAHAARYFDLLRAAGIDNARLEANEDIVISLSGEGRPRVHDFGTLHLCGSREARDVAASQQPGFREHRERLHGQIALLAG